MDEEPYRVKESLNFGRCLDDISDFLGEVDASHAFDRLMSELEATVLPNLERFPRIGRRFRDGPLQSTESLAALADLPLDAAQTLREYLHGDYILLYIDVPSKKVVHLLSIRHHRRLSFDFKRS